ncbi:DddA-like double-stranded DNA deaminase toxin [Micromonospora pisi]|uniref:DddA-like double-stranded DNA deaminase toxin n=1 Tax=Micromonospora pisi TaxID=589240 RepID=UPI000EAE437E|nr:DddA-like double-stranded DNA deaminase toxin [Micromonospora pisi]
MPAPRGGGPTAPGGGRAPVDAGRGTSPPGYFDPRTPGWERFERGQAPESVREAGSHLSPRTGIRETNGRSDGRDYSSGNDRSLADDLLPSRVPRDFSRLPYDPSDPGLNPRGRPNSFFQHAESQVAREMRDDARPTRNPDGSVTPPVGVTHRELVIDNGVCGTRGFEVQQGPGPSCDALLPDMMPEGSTLTVWSTTDGGETFFRKIYTGTGRYIDPSFGSNAS